MGKTYTVICQKWEEIEVGWGERPDGYSLHLTDQHRKQYVKEYWDGMPDYRPEEYSSPDGTPYQVDVEEEVYNEVKASKNGTRHSGQPPGSGGTDGWIAIK